MYALILGGQKPHNETWVQGMETALGDTYQAVHTMHYGYWDEPDQPDKPFDVRYEAGQLATVRPPGEYIVIAKSIGTFVTAVACAQRMIKPTANLFVGFPLGVIDGLPEADKSELIESFCSLPRTTVLQNEGDPLGSTDDVRAFFKAHVPASHTVHPLPGGTHKYNDFAKMARTAYYM